jgi:hypothetical protein
VFQLAAARPGAPASPVRPARPGELRVWVGDAPGPRPRLVADLIRRVAERHHLRAAVWQRDPADWTALNIHPAHPAPGPPDPLDVAITQAGERGVAAGPAGAAPAGDPAAPHRIGVAGTRTAVAASTGADPLALRVALLGHHYAEPLALTTDHLGRADRSLRDWRGQVARWALSPSRPMCAQYLTAILTALDTDLDTPAALRGLAALAADPEIPPGSKFEAFAYLDSFLGLDLARDVGR